MTRTFLGFAWIALLVALVTWLATFSPSYQKCVTDYADSARSNEAKKSHPETAGGISIRSLVFARCEGIFLDENSVLLTAIATLAIAGFTLTLKQSTDRLWQASEDQHAVSNRAFVFIDGFTTEITTAADAPTLVLQNVPERYRDRPSLYLTRFAVQPRWKNGGTTPTRRMRIQVNWGQFPPLPLPPEYGYEFLSIPFFIGPKAVEGSGFIEMPRARALIDYGAFRDGEPSMILIWGRADYEDVFDKPHFVEWCYELRFDMYDGKRLSATFIQIGNHNRTDEDTK